MNNLSKPARYALIAVGGIVGLYLGVLMGSGGTFGLLGMVAVLAGVGVLIYLGLRGNKSVAMADDAARTRALADEPVDAARLIVVREGFIGKMSGMDVMVDGRVLTQLKSPRFAVLPLDPGAHRVEVKVAMTPKPIGPVDLDLAAGETAVVRIVAELGAARLERERWSPALRATLARIPMVA